jgi:microcystin-dependent protein
MPFWKWSKTANNNATADPTINYSEGMAPSQLNDSARAAMAALAMYRDDISGAIVTAGTSTAYTVSSNSGFDTLAHLDGQVIAFTPHTTNDATVTLSVDGLTAKPLRSAPSVELQAGTIIEGTPYVAIYNNTDGAFYLQSLYGNPYNVPLGAGFDYWLPTTPNSSFVFPSGQAISRTTYSGLFAAMGTTYGTGDGSTTFNLPDKRGRLSIGKDNMNGSAAGRVTTAGSSIDGTTLGAAGGAQNHVLSAGEIPSITSNGSNTITVTGPTTGSVYGSCNATASIVTGSGGSTVGINGSNLNTFSFSGSNNVAVSSSNTGGGAHPIMNPSIVCNYIMRII